MIDLHCHILPGVDDGPATFDESIAMARLAVADGITTIVATPHLDSTYRYPTPTLIRDLTARLNQRLQAENLPLTVLPGAEVQASGELVEAVQAGRVMTVADRGKYVLVEFSSTIHATYAPELLFRLQLAGITPIIAHVERVALLRSRPELLDDFRTRGYILQVNADSLAGRSGWSLRRQAQSFVKQGLVSVVASDGHNVKDRKPLLTIARKAVRAEHLFAEFTHLTPARLLAPGSLNEASQH